MYKRAIRLDVTKVLAGRGVGPGRLKLDSQPTIKQQQGSPAAPCASWHVEPYAEIDIRPHSQRPAQHHYSTSAATPVICTRTPPPLQGLAHMPRDCSAPVGTGAGRPQQHPRSSVPALATPALASFSSTAEPPAQLHGKILPHVFPNAQHAIPGSCGADTRSGIVHVRFHNSFHTSCHISIKNSCHELLHELPHQLSH
eukprot:39813-Chlamydomonas_euryale.AAC.3